MTTLREIESSGALVAQTDLQVNQAGAETWSIYASPPTLLNPGDTVVFTGARNPFGALNFVHIKRVGRSRLRSEMWINQDSDFFA